MTREMKYKFWDKHNKVWVGPYTLKQLADEDAFSSAREWKAICSKWECYESVEYTGLKDCKGNEIFEGDIVQEIVTGKSVKAQVVFEQYSFRLKGIDRVWGGSLHWFRNNQLEVIGNIYENSELLQKQD